MTVEKLQAENEELRRRLQEAVETISAIQQGAVDAFVVGDAAGYQLYTLDAADRPYRLFVEEMQQGAATLHADGTIVFSNRQLSDLLEVPLGKLIGAALYDFIADDDRPGFVEVLRQSQTGSRQWETCLRRANGQSLPVFLTFNRLPGGGGVAIGVLVTDLTAQRHHEPLTAAHQALQASEGRLRLALDAGGMGAWTFDPVINEADWNEDLERLIGIACRGPGTVCARDFLDHIHQEDRPRVFADFKRTVRDGGSYRHEFRFCHPDGRTIWLAAHATAVRDPESGRRTLVGVNYDVTQRKQTEMDVIALKDRLADDLARTNRLHELSVGLVSAASLQEVYEQTLDAIIELLRADFGNIQIYDAASAELHIVAQRGFDQAFLEHFRVVTVQNSCVCCRTLKTGERIVVEDVEADADYEPHRQAAADAGYRAVQSTPLIAHDGTPLGILSTHYRQPHYPSESELRLTDLFIQLAAETIIRKRAEAALRDNEASLQNFIDTAAAGLVRNGRDLRYKAVNTAYARLAGLPVERIVGRPLSEVMGEEALEKIRPHVERVLRGERVEYEMELPFARSGPQWIHVIYTPDCDADGKIVGWVGSINDITARKQAEAALVLSQDKLREADRKKDEFLATLAHELRNPLVPIRTGLDVMRMPNASTEIIEQIRSMMERQIVQMVRLVDDLLDVSRITRGKIEIQRERVELAAVVSSALETSRPLIEQMGHELTVRLPKEPVVLDADPTRLVQVLVNLLNNAAKFMDQGGCIWLTAERQGGEVVVSVKDAGIGLAADQLLQVFDLFTQIDRSLEKAQGGLGIGLSLVKGLVELHGGRIEARSEGLGKGAEFIVRLPTVVKASAPQADDADENVPKSALRILVVDDNRDGADSLAMLLKFMGNDTRTAYDGVEAVSVAEAFRPDVLLLDIGMPKLNGFEACRRIREQPWGRKMVLIAQTGWGTEEDRQRSREAGFDHHLVKPVAPQALMALMAEMDDGQPFPRKKVIAHKARFPISGLYAITPDRDIAPEALAELVNNAIAGGARVIQLRCKNAAKRQAEAAAILPVCRRADIPLIINDDLELALRLGADGVHLGRHDASLESARRLLGVDAVIGVSCYDSVESALEAESRGASYVAFGRFFPSLTKPDAPCAHLHTLEQARRLLKLPIVAIGGITPSNASGLIAAGADVLAVIDAVFGDADVTAAARRFCSVFVS